MLSFREYLTEADRFDSPKNNKFGSYAGHERTPENMAFEIKDRLKHREGVSAKVTHTKLDRVKGLDIHKIQVKYPDVPHQLGSNSTEAHFVSHDPKTNMIHHHVKGDISKGVLHVDVLASSGKSPVKAHDFYHHLLKNHVKALVGTSHTEGGQKVWQRLANKRTVSIHGWNKQTKKPVNIDPKDPDQTHANWSEVSRHARDADNAYNFEKEHEPEERQKMALVASYHPLKKLRRIK